MKEYEFHEAANIFPLKEKTVKELVQAIRKNGQRDAITLLDGKILDGRGRYEACKRLKIEPEFDTVVLPETQIVEYVKDKNLWRRQLTTGEASKSAVAAKNLHDKYRRLAAKRKKEGQSKGGLVKAGLRPPGRKAKRHESRDDLAKDFGTTGRMIAKRERLQDHKKAIPEIEQAVDGDKLSLSAGDDIVKNVGYTGKDWRERQKQELDKAIAGDRSKKTKKRKEEGESREESEKKPPGVIQGKGVIYGRKAIDALAKIPPRDPTWKDAYEMVIQFLKHEKKRRESNDPKKKW